MNQLISKIESVLFVASAPLSIRKITQAVEAVEVEVAEALNILAEKYKAGTESGILLMHTNDEWQLVTNPEYKAIVEKFLKTEISGELTKPQLETLTVISYCGPVTRAELEKIRGVNCSLILRNLLMRGLVKETTAELSLLPTYEITIDYLRNLGIQSVTELPDYETLHTHEYLAPALQEE
jgi:segregation and condensation protein B